MPSIMQKLPRWLFVLLLLPLLAVAAFYLWAESPPQPMPEALRALNPIPEVTISETDAGWWLYEPTTVTPNQGFILYPGGRVDPRSYAPLARDLAVNGYLVVVPRMPLNLAFFAKDIASEIQAAYPDIEQWGLGGHSLGGAMAADFAANHPDAVGALVLWAAIPADNISLSAAPFPITIVYGTEDGLQTAAEVQASRDQFPPEANFFAIEGGNHAQFGWYGPQNNDLDATISRQDQTGQIIAATVQTLRRMTP